MDIYFVTVRRYLSNINCDHEYTSYFNNLDAMNSFIDRCSRLSECKIINKGKAHFSVDGELMPNSNSVVEYLWLGDGINVRKDELPFS